MRLLVAAGTTTPRDQGKQMKALTSWTHSFRPYPSAYLIGT